MASSRAVSSPAGRASPACLHALSYGLRSPKVRPEFKGPMGGAPRGHRREPIYLVDLPPLRALRRGDEVAAVARGSSHPVPLPAAVVRGTFSVGAPPHRPPLPAVPVCLTSAPTSGDQCSIMPLVL